MSSITRNDVKQLVATIESLARSVQDKLENDADFLPTAHELVRNNMTLTFRLGELYASGKTVTATAVKSGSNKVYHNVRDSRGRFAPKV